MKKILIASAAFLALGACDRAISNMQTLVSDNCGKDWKLIGVGQVVPARVGPCALKVTVPNVPMQGETVFRAAFMNNVLTNMSISYEYTITDPVAFISEAKYIGRQNSAGDGAENAVSVYESAENTIIDRRIREIASELLQMEDIVTFNQGVFEDKLLEEVLEMLMDRGVTMSYIAAVPIPDEQTRMAIDVAAARQVYESVGLGDVATEILVSRAGATRVIVNGKEE
jgi:hypothetical protein